MAIGHFVLALPPSWSFFTGMAFLISGNGFFKPNISTMVGRLYPAGDGRRDGAFSIFYMGVNIGAFLSGLICGYIGQKGYETFSFMTPENSWHYGFGLAGVCMVLGVINFVSFKSILGDIGLQPSAEPNANTPGDATALPGIKPWMVYVLSVLLVPVFIFLFQNFKLMGYIMIPFCIIATMFMVYLSFSLESKEARQMMLAAVIMVVFSTLFWAFYEQGGGSLNLFADRNVDLLGMGAAAVNNSINPFLVILLSTPFAALWLYLARRGKEPSTPMKFSLAFIQLGLGFLIFVIGAKLAGGAGKVSFSWFVLGYFFLTTGELCLSPIGLSMITKLSPARFTGMMMGFWFLASAMGQYLAGIVGTLMAVPSHGGASTVSAAESLGIYSGVFMNIFYVSIGVGLVLLLLVPILKRWSSGVKQ
jgi:POT family proton-dependent oligopeptide transporter